VLDQTAPIIDDFARITDIKQLQNGDLQHEK